MFVFDGLKSLLPKVNATITDNNVFRLHYKVTVVILIAFVILATCREHIGMPIACMDIHGVPTDVVNQFCWVNATHSVKSKFDIQVGISGSIYPGVGQPISEEDKVHHKYYQWVAFMLFLQAVMFYLPRYFWKIWEGNKIKMLLLEMNCPIIEHDDESKKVELINDYFVRTIRSHNGYLIKYIFCEVLNFFNIIGQIYLTDRFLDWNFLTLGSKVMKYVSDEAPNYTDPMIRVFPRLTKCEFFTYGSGGGFQQQNTNCVLPLNIVNEKIYIFLWFWFITLAVVTGLNLIYRAIIIFLPTCRVLLMRSKAILVPVAVIASIVQHTGVGDWFVLYTLSKNMNPLTYRELLEKLSDSLGKKSVASNFKDSYL